MQSAENLTDRAAVHRVRYGMDLKYALGLELDDPGFDASVLSEFRTRLVKHGMEEKVLDLLLTALKDRGLVKAGGRQRTTDSDEHLLALLLTLKSYQRMGCFPKVENIPEAVAEFVRRAMELPEGTLAVYRAAKTMNNHLGLVRQRVGVAYDQGRARRIAEESIRKEAASTNRPGDPPWRTWAGEGAGREVPGPCASGYEDLGAQTGGGVALRVRPGGTGLPALYRAVYWVSAL
ncbi:transposase [Streptomyces sp. NPDC057565]|uniref:transposase n=1 Tax=Streptomyces sp. NPDC057565 TaxID=3346169 RepID=UPI0036A73367